ncbi:MAG: 2-oxo acid dehydrogenase subunit E2 [Spirochaetaceae bacterium]|nr:MAG: 2-oxo acid dehydrogenase subunit E2 [Spirochaetaceae bacterium]
MAHEVLMPRQGQSVESCIILAWKKKKGDSVSAGESICEVETDKATFEVEAPEAGTVLATLFDEGDDVPVLTPIAYIGEAGESVPDAASAPTADAAGKREDEPAAEAAVDEPPAKQTPGPAETRSAPASDGPRTDRVFVSPRARRTARDLSVDAAALSGTGPGGRVLERDVIAAAGAREPLTRAAREMVEAGAPRPNLGTGPGGRVTRADVESAGARSAGDARAAAEGGTATRDFPGAYDETPVKGVRKVIAERMLASLTSTAQLTMSAHADARALLAYRKKLKNSPPEMELSGVTINDLVHFAVARTLLSFRAMNAHFLETTIREFDHVHLGFAVDTPRGLLVPTVRFADELSLSKLAAEARRLAEKAIGGTADADELSGATFTVTNLGALGITSFTPVLNPPQAAILGVCAIELRPVQTESGVEHHPHIGLSLTIDHRAVDGAPAARFLNALCTTIANFELILAR